MSILLKSIKPIKTHSEGAGSIEIESIIILPRQRKDSKEWRIFLEEHITPSIAEHGLIQPIVLNVLEEASTGKNIKGNEIKSSNILVAGFTRCQAFLALGHKKIPFVRRKDLPEHERKALELEENLRRQDMPWQDVCLGIYHTHTDKVSEKAKNYETWGSRQTGAILGVSASHIRTTLIVAERLLAGDKDIVACTSMDAALGVLLARKQDAATKRLADLSGHGVHVSSAVRPAKRTNAPRLGPLLPPDDNLIKPSVKKQDTEKEKPTKVAEQHKETKKIEISNMLFNEDCHDFMAQCSPELFDLVLTDIPYGIDMDMLEDMKDIKVVAHTHEIEENVEQMKPFLEGAMRVLKDRSYLMFFYDLKHHEKLHQWAVEVGFKPMPFPIVWLKTHGCKNRAPQCHWTKATEYMMVCRKGNATLRNAQTKNYFAGSAEAERKMQRNPFAKSFEFLRQVLDPIVVPGMTVLDPYAGGGSILRACVNLGCRIVGVEKDEAQFPDLVKNIKDVYTSMLHGKVEFV